MATKKAKVKVKAPAKAPAKTKAKTKVLPKKAKSKIKGIAGPSEEAQKAGDVPGAKARDGIDPAGKKGYDPPPRPGSSGTAVGTAETRILACQCGSTKFDVKKRTRTAINLVCAKCGMRASVKGNVATVRVRQQEITYAMQHTVVTPDESSPGAGSGGGKKGEKQEEAEPRGMRRYAHSEEVLETVVDRAMEAVRVMNCADDKFREQTWQGHALEFICADFLSGCSHDVLQIVDAMDAAEEDALRIAEQDGKPEPAARKIRDLRAKVRDKLAVESGLLPPEKASDDGRQLDLPDGSQPEEGSDEEPGDDDGEADGDEGEKPKEKPEVETVPDGGRLLRAVVATMNSYMEEARGADVRDKDMPENVIFDGPDPSKEQIQKWSKRGGYLVRILGDERTAGADGKRAAVCAWVASEPANLALDFSLEYDDATDDLLGDGSVEVVELLPPDYKEIDQWNKPHFADRRETL
ncbi:MAG: hypothetical protein ABFD77_04290 [Thermotogota bacterium]